MPLRTRFLLSLLVLAALLALGGTATAHNGPSLKVVASGLDNPRHLAFGGDNLYVAESGRGGPCVGAPPDGPICVGATGAVTVIDEDGDQRRLVEGLASLAFEDTGESAFGPHGVYVRGKNHVLITNGGPGELNREELVAQNPVADLFGRVLRIGRDGGIERLADIWGFERDINPDREVGTPGIDSNAVDVLADRGRLIVADAGGNSLLKVRKSGAVEVLSVFANRCIPEVPEPCEPEETIQTVPTGVVKGPHGDYFMSQLTGFPYPVGAANVYRVDRKTGEAEVFARGFTNIMDLAFDEDGTLWVLEIDHDSLFGPPVGPSTDGAIFAVSEDGEKKQLELEPGSLTLPGGITVGEDDALYVTNKATAVGGGEVLRIEVEADAEDDDD